MPHNFEQRRSQIEIYLFFQQRGQLREQTIDVIFVVAIIFDHLTLRRDLIM